MMTSLFKSRKALIALLGVLQSLTLHYLAVPTEVWQSINGLLLVLIAGIAIEDAGKNVGLPPPVENAAPIPIRTAPAPRAKK